MLTPMVEKPLCGGKALKVHAFHFLVKGCLYVVEVAVGFDNFDLSIFLQHV
jgi:hypothetical protein